MTMKDPQDIHPRLRRQEEPPWLRCRACGLKGRSEDLTEDLLCRDCDRVVKDLEAGKI